MEIAPLLLNGANVKDFPAVGINLGINKGNGKRQAIFHGPNYNGLFNSASEFKGILGFLAFSLASFGIVIQQDLPGL